MLAIPSRGCLTAQKAHKQSGQALVYGLFMLTAGLAALFFLFNVGQLTQEKTKLVNTSDAVAYSAGVMHARALNYASYTNRALVADEVAIAQAVSLASWGKYLQKHGASAMALGCNPENYYISEPAAVGMLRYTPVCNTLGSGQQFGVLSYVNQAIQYGGIAVVAAAELSKVALQASQAVVALTLKQVRLAVMQEVANANYAGEGEIQVQEFQIPLLDTFLIFDGGLPILNAYTGTDRTRMRDFETKVVSKDGFTPSRAWSDEATIPSCVLGGLYYNKVVRNGGTQLIGFDEWRANDAASYYRWRLVRPKLKPPRCEESESSLGNGKQSALVEAGMSTASDRWPYSGVPSYLDLSKAALGNEDPRAQFAVRVLRSNTQTRTSDARSDIKTTPRLNAYVNSVPQDQQSGQQVYVGLAATETFFKRTTDRIDGSKELASLFNPYWQTHLMEVPTRVRAAAQTLQGAVTP